MYRQLTYFCNILDTVRCIDKVIISFRLVFSVFIRKPIYRLKVASTFQIEGSNRLTVEKELARVRPMAELAASTVQKIRDRCAYGWVQLKDLTVTI